MNAEDVQASIEVVINSGCSGIIATNTTNQRPHTTNRLEETGGLSGNPLWDISKQQLH